jgi:hypothetical protein
MTGPATSDREDHEEVQEVLSAAADGEQTDELALRAAHRHADRCDRCHSFRQAVGDSGPLRADVGNAPAARTRTILPEPPRLMRLSLWGFGILNIAIGLPLLLRIDAVGLSGADPSHLTRDGALAVILGAASCATAHQPRWARPMAAVAAVVIVLNLLGGGSDVARGSVRWTFEVIHIVNAFTAGLVVACAWWTRPQVSRSR